jgi:hypothetical protein
VPEPQRNEAADVVEMVDYLRETLREMDEGITEMQERRRGIATRIAVIEAAGTDAVRGTVAEYERRSESNEPYRGEDAKTLLSEAHRRFGQ